MLNWKLFNPRDVVMIVAVAVLLHMLCKPLYAMIDGATGNPTPDAS